MGTIRSQNKSSRSTYVDQKGRTHSTRSSAKLSTRSFDRKPVVVGGFVISGEGMPLEELTHWGEYFEQVDFNNPNPEIHGYPNNPEFEQLQNLLDYGYSCAQLGLGTIQPGDVNNDATLDVLDIIIQMNMALGNFPGELTTLLQHVCISHTVDINQNQSLNVADVVLSVNNILDGVPFGYEQYICDDDFGHCSDESQIECYLSDSDLPDGCGTCITEAENYGEDGECVYGRGETENDSGRHLEVNQNYVGCPSIWGHVDPNTGNPYINHDWNCFEDINPAQAEFGNPIYCHACYDPGNTDGAPNYIYVCNNNLAGSSWVGDSSCNDQDGIDGCSCIIKPDYVCSNDINTSYGLDSGCNGQCNYIYGSCVDKTISCCLRDFPYEWFDRYKSKYVSVDEIPTFSSDYSLDLSIKYNSLNNVTFDQNDLYGYRGNSGPRKVSFNGILKPEPNTNHGWDNLVCSDYQYTGDACDGENALAGDSCDTGVCVNIGGPYDNLIVAVFGANSDYCGPGGNLLSCSECEVSDDEVTNCDIRGLSPRLEHNPVTEANSVAINPGFWDVFNNLQEDWVGYVCNGGIREGQACSDSNGFPDTDWCDPYGNNPDNCENNNSCIITCDVNVTGPPTLFQKILYEDYVVPYEPYESHGTVWSFLDDLLYFDNNLVGTYPIIPAECDDNIPTGAEESFNCQRHRYAFPIGQEDTLDSDNPEMFILKVYDPITMKVFTSGCFGFTNMSIKASMSFDINTNRTCSGADYDADIPVLGECSHDPEVRCFYDDHCQMTTEIFIWNDDGLVGSSMLAPSTCLIAGCTDPDACNENTNAQIEDGSCEYPQTYCVDPDNDGVGSCPDENPEWCVEDVCDHPGDNYVLVNEDNQCDEDPFCPNICGGGAESCMDDCNVCDGGNYCINGTLDVQGGTCTCPDGWDWVVNGPCWESSGPDSGFDCRGQCLGGWVVDPCNMGDDDYTDIGWRCTENVNIHKEWCYADRDRDGNGCDPTEILNNPCIQILMCPGYNAINNSGSEWPYENQCPCPTPDDLETECWSLTHTDASDWCDQWSDGCGHCVDTEIRVILVVTINVLQIIMVKN